MVIKEKLIIGLSGTLFLLVFVFPTSVSSNIDCNGKAFHCLNSTHFKICVDLGGGVSSTVDDFIVPCPPPTLCKNTNHFECEFPTSTTAASNITSEVTNDIKTSVTEAWETISSTTISSKLSSEGEISAIQMNTVSTATPVIEKSTLYATNINETSTRSVLDDQVTPSSGINKSTYFQLETVNSSTSKPVKHFNDSTSLPLAVNESSLTSVKRDSYTTVITTEALKTDSLSALIKNENTTTSIGEAYLSTTPATTVISKQAPNNTSSVTAIKDNFTSAYDGGLSSTTEGVYISTLQSAINDSLFVTGDNSPSSSAINKSFITTNDGSLLTTPVAFEISTLTTLKDNSSEIDRSLSSSVIAVETSTSSYNENLKTTPISERLSTDSVDSKVSLATDGSKIPSSVMTNESSTTITNSSRVEFTPNNHTSVKDESSLSTSTTSESFASVNNGSLLITTQAIESSSVNPVFNENTSTIDISSLSFTVVNESFISTNNESLTSTAAPFEISNLEIVLNRVSTASNTLYVPSDENFTTSSSKLENYESPLFITENLDSPLNFSADSIFNISLTTKSIEDSTFRSIPNNESTSLLVKNDNSSYSLTKIEGELTTTETIGSQSSNIASDVTVSLAPATDKNSFVSYYDSTTVPILFESTSSNNVINNNDILSFNNKSLNLDFNKDDKNHTLTSIKEDSSSKNTTEMDAVINIEKSYSQSLNNDSIISVTEALPLELNKKENDNIITTEIYVLTTKPTTFDTSPPTEMITSTTRINNNSTEISEQQDVHTILPKVLESTSINPFEYIPMNKITDQITITDTATLSPFVEIGVTVNQTQSSETKITTVDYYTTSLPETDKTLFNKEVQLEVAFTNSILNNMSSISNPIESSTTDKTHLLPSELTGSVSNLIMNKTTAILDNEFIVSSTNNPLENPNVETTTIMINVSSYPVENSTFLDSPKVLSENVKTEGALTTLSHNETNFENPLDKFTMYSVGTEEFITSTPTNLVISNNASLGDVLYLSNISKDIKVTDTVGYSTVDNTKNISAERKTSISIFDSVKMLTNTGKQSENNTVVGQNMNNLTITKDVGETFVSGSVILEIVQGENDTAGNVVEKTTNNSSKNSNIEKYLDKLAPNASLRTDLHFGSNAGNSQSNLPSVNIMNKEKSVRDDMNFGLQKTADLAATTTQYDSLNSSVSNTGKILDLLSNISKKIVEIQQNTSKSLVLSEQDVINSPKEFENIPIGQYSSTISDVTASSSDVSHSNTADNKFITASNVLAPTVTTNADKAIPHTLISPVTVTAQNTNEQSSAVSGSYSTVPERTTVVTGENRQVYSSKVTENAGRVSKLNTDGSSFTVIKDNITKIAFVKPVVEVPLSKKIESIDASKAKSDSLKASSNVAIIADQNKVRSSDITGITVASKWKNIDSTITDKLDNVTPSATLTISTEKSTVAIKRNDMLSKVLTVAEGHQLNALQINDTSLKTILNQNTVNLGVDKIGNIDVIAGQNDNGPIVVTQNVHIPLFNNSEYANSSGIQYIDEISSKKTNISDGQNKSKVVYTALGNVEQNDSNISLSNVPIIQQNVNSSLFNSINKYSIWEKNSQGILRNTSKDSVRMGRNNADSLPNVLVSNVIKSNSNTEDTLVAAYNQSNIGGSSDTQENATVNKTHVSNSLPIVSGKITNTGKTAVQNMGNIEEHTTRNSLTNISINSSTSHEQHVKLVPSTSENITSKTEQIPITLKNNAALREQNESISLSNMADNRGIIFQTESFQSPLYTADRSSGSSYDIFLSISTITKHNSEKQNATKTNKNMGAKRDSDSLPNLSGKPILQTFNGFSSESENNIRAVKQNISIPVFDVSLINIRTAATEKNVTVGVSNDLKKQKSNTSNNNTVQFNTLFIQDNATLEKFEQSINRSLNVESGNRNVSSSQKNSDAASTLFVDKSHSLSSSSSTQEYDIPVSNDLKTVRYSKGPLANKLVNTSANIGENSSDVTSTRPRTENINNHFNCHNRRRGRYGDNNDCRKFFICIGRNQPVLGQCPLNTVFSEVKKQCIKNLSHCVRNNEFRCVTEGRFSDEFRENSYFICVKNGFDFVRFKFQCQNNYRLNRDTVKCIHIEILNSSSVKKKRSKKGSAQGSVESNDQNLNTDSEDDESSKDSREVKRRKKNEGEKSNTNENGFECEKEGKFPDPEDRECRRYYVCERNKRSQYRRRRKRCDSDEAFDKDKQKCVDADTVECE